MHSTNALTAATVIKLLHMPLQAGIPGPVVCAPLLPVPASWLVLV